MDDQHRVMQELEERLDQILLKIEPLLNTEELSLIRWACGKSTSQRTNHVSDIT